ncbi:alpha/beta hydrolase [Parabacteroides sp. FAFU027]|uniref:alpha/beta hydrolase n=1 Tax=Parabacteroides sp. FAFU027 TaxID=2922715 RepID=UPI001FAEB87A|nr:alpha/beta hydrolase [Parabacteroides sp. FAFU027]
MKKTFGLLLSLLFSSMTFAQSPIDIPVWKNGAPDHNGIEAPESFTNEGHALNCKEARMYVYLPQKSDSATAAVLICPGGGYARQAMMHEGHDVAKWLNSKGIAGIVLKYRLPNGYTDIPLEDAQEAMKVIRANAKAWNIKPDKVGVCGFSAGGHLASTLGTHFDNASRPDFMILYYPVISMKPGITHSGSRSNLLGKNPEPKIENRFSNEEQITPQTPPTLLILSDDDKTVPPVNSTLFYNALKSNKIPATMYIFPNGGHGFGFRETFAYHDVMTQLLWDWLQKQVK